MCRGERMGGNARIGLYCALVQGNVYVGSFETCLITIKQQFFNFYSVQFKHYGCKLENQSNLGHI